MSFTNIVIEEVEEDGFEDDDEFHKRQKVSVSPKIHTETAKMVWIIRENFIAHMVVPVDTTR